MLHGILNCYKPKGWTSRDVVNRVTGCLRPAKVGHAGTLDPLAEGVLVLAVGSASRLVPMLHLYEKTYQASFALGRSSASDDIETEVQLETNPAVPTAAELTQAASQLTGQIQQIPPIYSAVKVDGRRAYDAARRQEEITLRPRTVQVDRFELTRYEYPELEATITCGTGTYIRTLGVDLARAVGTSAVMTRLVRTSVGPFSHESAVCIDPPAAERESLGETLRAALQPLATAVGLVPQIQLTAELTGEIEHGRYISLPEESIPAAGPEGHWAALDPQGRLRAILERRGELLGPRRVFPVA